MRITNEASTVLDEIKEIVCNMCNCRIDQNKFGYFAEHITIEKRWGYGSKYDGETHKIDICHTCYEKLQELLALPPCKSSDSSAL